MSHIVESCPLTKLNGGLSQLNSADEDAVLWLTNWFMTCIREEEEEDFLAYSSTIAADDMCY